MKSILSHYFAVLLGAVSLLSGGVLQAAEYGLSMPHYEVKPGDTVKVPLTLSNVTHLTQIRVQVNYDPQVLEFVSAVKGPLGELFNFESTNEKRVLTLDFDRMDSLESGAGVLAVLEFKANAGSTVDLNSDLTIAKFEMSDESGLKDLAVTSLVQVNHGFVQVSSDQNIDNAKNGLPDWWEKDHGMNPMRMDAGDLDDDKDGMQNIFEYHFGANPNISDAVNYRPQDAFDATHRFLTLTFRRRKGVEGERLSVWESEDLKTWSLLDPATQMPTPPEDLGDGFERVILRGLLPVGDDDGPSRTFLRLHSDDLGTN